MQGAYIPPVLREPSHVEASTQSKDHSHSGMGYHSFGNTDHMGRRNTPTSPTGGSFSPTMSQQQSTSTLERNTSTPISSSKPGGGGGGGVANGKETKDPLQKSFV